MSRPRAKVTAITRAEQAGRVRDFSVEDVSIERLFNAYTSDGHEATTMGAHR